MASKRRKKEDAEPAASPEGMFKNMVVFLVETGVRARRLQVWKQKLVQMGATIEGHLSRRVTHVFAMTLDTLLHQVDRSRMIRFKGSALAYRWLEDSLKHGERMLEDSFRLEELEKVNEFGEHLDDKPSENLKRNTFVKNLLPYDERAESSKQSEARDATEKDNMKENNEEETTGGGPLQLISNVDSCRKHSEEDNKDSTSLYTAPDLNRNITEIFGKLINIYRALGDDRRSFSYHKAISVIEKLPFKIQSVDQVKALPSIGKSMQDHIHEIVTTGKLLKLEHFESDEKVRTVALFGEVWGIGPATALKLYEKGHRSLSDLEKEDSLTSSQKTGLKYFEDINTRIPREEVKDMETLLQKAGEDVLPGVIIICGGSYRRGKATCGDMDIVITHPDGESHKGFLVRYVQYLKDIKFLREDLVFSIHSIEGTDSGVDTYFGLCTYPGREQRHRIDFKVYPRNIFAFGLIAWTGNDVLNRRLRLLAETKGYRLDDTGLYLATQSSGGKKGTKSSTSVKCNTEKEVFDFLGFPWLEPRERNL